MSSSHWFYFYVLPLLPALLTIGGWVFIHNQEQNKRKLDRKDKRIDSAIELLDKIEKETLIYYFEGINDDNDRIANSIKQNIKWLSKLCSRINDQLNPEIIALRTACTGGDFQSSKRKVLPLNSFKFFEIREAVFKLRDKLDSNHDY